MKNINKYFALKSVIIIIFALIFLKNVSTAQSSHQEWILQSRVTNQMLNAVYFTDNQNGFIVGNAGTMVYTSNAGEQWLTISGLTSEDLNDVIFLNASTGIIVGNNGTILVTNNWGSNLCSWRMVINDFSSNLKTVTAGAKGIVYAAGDNGFIICAKDNLDEWNICTTSQLKYRGSSAKGTNKIWVVGEEGQISMSFDAGETFVKQASNTTNDLNTIFMYNATRGFIGGQRNILLYTENGGRKWIQRKVGDNNSADNHEEKCSITGIYSSKFAVWTVCTDGDIYMSQDMGVSWKKEISAVTSSLSDVFFSDDHHAWAVGAKGIILYRCDVCDNTNINTNPVQSGLEQNSPNPFNPSTSITFRVAESGPVSLKIYDVLGREIESLVNQNLMPGIYETEWNSSNYASGVYFYILKTEKFYETKRMILIK